MTKQTEASTYKCIPYEETDRRNPVCFIVDLSLLKTQSNRNISMKFNRCTLNEKCIKILSGKRKQYILCQVFRENLI